MPELTTAPVETAIDAADELYFNDVSETPDALNRITYANLNGANLSAIKGLTSAADKGIQFTGAGTAAVFDLTAAGKALLDDADAAAQRATLGLVIGTNVQAFDTDLGVIAALAPSNDDILQRKAGAWANRTIAQLKTDLAYSIPVNIDDLTDVVITTPSNDDVLTYNGGTWINSPPAGGGGIDGSGSAGVLAGWVDADTLEAVAGLTSPAGVALRIEGQASGDVGLIVRGNTSDDDNILELRRGSNDGMNVSWGTFGDMTVEDRFIYLKAGADIRGGWHPTQGGWMIVPGYAYCFTNGNSFNTIDARLERIGVSIVGLRDGSGGGAAFSLVEQTAPAAPAANGMYQWLEDNGSGKTRWMCRFGSGAAVQVAIEP